MWAKLLEAKNRYIAEVWRELLNEEAVAVRIVVPAGADPDSALSPREVWVPDSKVHVAREVLRKV